MRALAPVREGEMSAAERRQWLFLQASPFLLAGEANELLGGGEGEAMKRLESGRLRAIDISAEWPDAKRRELRIYRYSVCHCLTSKEPLAWLSPEGILLSGLAPIRRGMLAALLRCSLRHLGKLAKTGALESRECARGTAAGPRELLPITAPQALWGFLREREVVL